LTDPLSGFFMMRRTAYDRVSRKLSTIGYKILIDMILSAKPPLKVTEIGYDFRTRTIGESKLDTAVSWEFGQLLLDKLVGHIIPIRFIMFSIIGGFGVAIHMLSLALFMATLALSFVVAQTLATLVAMTFNFFANNLLTYRDRRLKGALPMAKGLLSFWAVCSIGAVANVGIAVALFQQHYAWWLSAMAGIIVGAVWNYAASAVFTWRL
ncbi:MAG: GtrA family protein, partial [Hyphomicrobiaceae bacterium]